MNARKNQMCLHYHITPPFLTAVSYVVNTIFRPTHMSTSPRVSHAMSERACSFMNAFHDGTAMIMTELLGLLEIIVKAAWCTLHR
jgi:hypothetical protein